MVGELAALATAVCWTGSSLFFAMATRRTHGLAVNQFRLLLALPVLAVLHWLLQGDWRPALDGTRLALLCVSGLVGLVLGDIGYFYALGVLGPRLSSVLMSTWPGMAALLAWWWSDDRPEAAAAAGIAVTMTGVMLVLLRQRDGSAWRGDRPAGNVPLAIAGALLGALGQAGGSVLVEMVARPAPELPAGVPGISCALVRMAAAAVGITVVALVQRRPLALRAVVASREALPLALLGTVCGPIVGVWLSMVALANGRVGVVAALTATTPLFMLPVARLAYGARVGWLGVVGTLLAVAGIAVLMLPKMAGS